AEQMAEDLRRFLADKPVFARRSSTAEQVLRWCRRNPALAASSALAMVGLVTAVVVLAISHMHIVRSSRALEVALKDKDLALRTARESEAQTKLSAAEAVAQRGRAEAGEAQAKAAVDEFLTKVSADRLLKAPGSQGLRRDLLRSALQFYQEFLKQHGNDPGLLADLAGVHLKLGTIQSELGDGRDGRRSFQAALAIYQELANENPNDPTILRGLATTRFRIGDNSAATALWEKLKGIAPDDPENRRDLAEAYNSLAIEFGGQKKFAEQLETTPKALALREGLVRDYLENLEYKMSLGSTLINLGV